MTTEDEEHLRQAIRKYLEVAQPSSKPDVFTMKEWKQQWQDLVIEGGWQNLKERKKYAKYIFIMICVWLFLVLLIVVLDGMGRIPWTCTYQFELSDAVLIALVTTTTFNIAAFFLVVTKHLFPTGNYDSSLKIGEGDAVP